jgi:hypothetical protein
MPRFPLLKEWAYAGFFFLMTGAVFSHLANGDDAKELLGPALLLILTGVSWYFRPPERKVIFNELRKEEYEQREEQERGVVA